MQKTRFRLKFRLNRRRASRKRGDGEVLEPSYARDEAIQGISMSLAKSIAALAGTANAIANHRHDLAVA